VNRRDNVRKRSVGWYAQVFNCRGYGGGDVIDMVQHLDGCDFKTARAALAGEGVRPAPISTTAVPKVAGNDQERIARALRIWNDAGPIKGSLAEIYLRRRGLEPLDDDEALRFHPACWFDGSAKPCMIALFRDVVTNEPKAIQRTAFKAGGFKLDRMSLGPTGGCAVKLTRDEDVTSGLHIGEGVETVLAGMQRGFRPAAFGLLAGNAAGTLARWAAFLCLVQQANHQTASNAVASLTSPNSTVNG